MTYAIFKAKGKQFRAEPDATLRVPSLDAEPGETITFEEVLLGSADGRVLVGTPALEGAFVRAEVVRHGKDDKIVVFKMKRRKNYRRKQGHRQRFTEIRVLGIDLGPGSPKRGAKPKARRPEPSEPPPPEAPEAREPEATADVEVNITKAARELAEAHDLDLSEIEGSGKDGRILKGDVEKAIKARDAGQP